MTAEEKAKELINNFLLITVSVPYKKDFQSNTRYKNGQMTLISAKQCALIAVDEIIESFSIHDLPDSVYIGVPPNMTLIGGKEYYRQVKEEITKL